MEPLLYILAFAGVSAVLIRLGGALLRLVQRSGEAWIAREAASRREEHGDITGMGEAAQLAARAHARRRNATLLVVLWIAALLVPPFTPWTLELYASYSLLWLVRARVTRGHLVHTRGPS